MLYPKVIKNKEKNKFIEKIEYIKESILVLLKALSNYNSFIMFFKQKFHF